MTNSKRKSTSSSPEIRKKRSTKHSKKEKHRRNLSPENFQKSTKNYDDRYDSTGNKIHFNTKFNQKDDICGYTNDNNPFFDPNLTEQFVWKKKNSSQQTTKNCQQKEDEIQRVQQRMKEHERIREERQLEQEIMQRIKESQSLSGRKSDSTFDFDQAKLRSKIRIAEGRGKPIDSFIQYLEEESQSDNEFESILLDPSEIVFGFNESDLRELLSDIEEHSKNLESGENSQFWQDVKEIATDRLRQLTNIDNNRSIAKESIEEMQKMINGGSIEDAIELYNDAKIVLETGDQKHIDVSYYEFFCRFAKVLISRRRLQKRHSRNLKNKLRQLKEEQDIDRKPIISHKSSRLNEREDYLPDQYEPVLYRESDLEDDEVVRSAEDDWRMIELMRKRFIEFGSCHVEKIDRNDELLRRAQDDNEQGDVEFDDQMVVDDKSSSLWSDKYRPRKPRFLNRVNIGYDWNKYNQTHYDIDNPPPKIVQGYKFNILYPDLIDKTKTPTFEVINHPDNEAESIIRFKAGPPYQDIAFKIVNKEWETSERFGYKCQFYRDMLQLHFHFKRYRYRK